MFITFEGADGSGKSTQIEYVQNHLSQMGYSVTKTRDPGGTDLGQTLRNILLNYPGKISSNAELFIFLADRAQHIDTKIKPALDKGQIVLCDRYIDSTVAYQGYGRGLDIDQINFLNGIVTQNILPEYTFLFDVSTDVAMKRIQKNRDSKDRIELEMEGFHQKVSAGYRTISKQNPERFVIIDANQDIETVKLNVLSEIDKFFQKG